VSSTTCQVERGTNRLNSILDSNVLNTEVPNYISDSKYKKPNPFWVFLGYKLTVPKSLKQFFLSYVWEVLLCVGSNHLFYTLKLLLC
jgi:hypothetical protein